MINAIIIYSEYYYIYNLIKKCNKQLLILTLYNLQQLKQ